jgi:RHS repeat-associated protein
VVLDHDCKRGDQYRNFDGLRLPTRPSWTQSDRLLATVDQPLVNGAATGSSTIRYVHTDNLGTTQDTSDANGNLASWYDYAPYGSVLASTNTGTATTARQFIGQFTDASSLSYLQNRYYDPAQGQFTSEDPIFLAIGSQAQVQHLSQQDQQKLLSDPQGLNAYGYGRDNPLSNKDPQGLWALQLGGEYTASFFGYSGDAGVYIDQNGIDYYAGAGWAPRQPGGGNVSAMITIADLSHTYTVSTSLFAAGGCVSLLHCVGPGGFHESSSCCLLTAKAATRRRCGLRFSKNVQSLVFISIFARAPQVHCWC